jgi:phosphoadenosine phosphosulfate reductase
MLSQNQNLSPKEFVKEYSIKSLVCSFSGGKDSLVATHFVMSELQDVDIDKYVIYADTGVMLPTTTPYVEKVCKEYGWNLTIVYGNFWNYIENGYPMPSMFRRWCCGLCKLEPIQEFVKTLKPQRAEVTGLRRDESIRRRKLKELFYLRKSLVWKYAPILEWTEKDVARYIREHDLPMPPHYKLGIKETCQCGAFGSKKQMMILKAQFPELFQKFIDAEANFKTHGAAFFFNNQPVYARDLAKQKTLEVKT